LWNRRVPRSQKQGRKIMLSPYRVLDLTDEGAMICGQILGDLGADVILVEPPPGAKARQIGPFADDQREVNRSLNFWSLNRNKRGITIDLETGAGRENLLQLVMSADILVESFGPRPSRSPRPWLQRLGQDQPGSDHALHHALRPAWAESQLGRDRPDRDRSLGRAFHDG
jgi:CoA transferase family III